ncbi:hypothetical protein U1Q18_040619 [Sarracenia purpurea var. burkii]
MSSEQKSQSKSTEGGTSMPVADDAVTETELEGAVPSPLVFDVMREVKSPVDRALEGTPDACKVVLPKSSSAGDQ